MHVFQRRAVVLCLDVSQFAFHCFQEVFQVLAYPENRLELRMEEAEGSDSEKKGLELKKEDSSAGSGDNGSGGEEIWKKFQKKDSSRKMLVDFVGDGQHGKTDKPTIQRCFGIGSGNP